MRLDDTSVGSPQDTGPDVRAGTLAGSGRYQEVRRALADALRLARLQADVLVRLDEADRAGDDGAVLRCHAELDHIMARMAEAEQVRTGAPMAPERENDLVCAGCGEVAEPLYERPRLLGYRCGRCVWRGDDPAAQAERDRAVALGAAAESVHSAVRVLDDVLPVLARRGRRARTDSASAVRDLLAKLSAVDRQLRKTK